MTNKIAFLVVIIAISIIVSGCGRDIDNTVPFVEDVNIIERQTIHLQDVFYDKDLFARAISSSDSKDSADLDSRVILVPHHLLASEIINNLFLIVQDQAIDTVIVIGPNHEDSNASTIATAHLEWQTPFGTIKTHQELIESFIADLGLQDLPEAFAQEHSVGAILPFVRYYIPKAQVVPIIFNSTATLSDAQGVAQWLAANASDNTLIVVSTDFSHYLSKSQADANDKITKDFILGWEIDKIINLGNDYLDSPASLAAVMIYAKNSGLAPKILYNKNSDDFLEMPTVETTSYFGIAFTQR